MAYIKGGKCLLFFVREFPILGIRMEIEWIFRLPSSRGSDIIDQPRYRKNPYLIARRGNTKLVLPAGT